MKSLSGFLVQFVKSSNVNRNLKLAYFDHHMQSRVFTVIIFLMFGIKVSFHEFLQIFDVYLRRTICSIFLRQIAMVNGRL